MSEVSNNELINKVSGFWTVIFSAGPNFNGGVATLTNGLIYGGDNAFFYVGKYSQDQSKITARIDCKAFAKNALNIFGTQIDNYSLEIDGTLSPDGTIIATGKIPAAPHLVVSLRMTKRLNL